MFYNNRKNILCIAFRDQSDIFMFLYADSACFMSDFKIELRKSHERRLAVYSNGRISEMTITKSIFRRVNIFPVYPLKYANMMPVFPRLCCQEDSVSHWHINETKLARRANYTSLLLRYACGDGFHVDVTCNEVGCIYVPGKYIYHANEYAASDSEL